MQNSDFYTPEVVWWLVLLHCYKGLGKQRVEIQNAIVPPLQKGQNYTPFPFDEYDVRWESWRVPIATAVQFNVPLSDPTLLFTYYEMAILGGSSEMGVLEQFPALRRQLDNFKDQHDVVNLRATHVDKVKVLIATFHSKVQSHMKASSPKTGRTCSSFLIFC